MAEQATTGTIEFVRRCASELVQCLQAVQADAGLWSDDERASAAVARAVDHCLGQLSSTGLWGKHNEVASNEFWNTAGSLLECGELQNQARTKPRKMAGDFQMLERICGNYECEHPLGRLFDRYFQQQAAPQAVRNRIAVVAGAIENAVRNDGFCNLVSIGSGPAAEVRAAVAKLDAQQQGKVAATLIDIDEDALHFAAGAIQETAPAVQVQTHRMNLQRYATAKVRTAHLAPANLVYCLGLFDYLEDKAFETLLAAMWNGAGKGCRIMAFNFSSANPSRAYMEWIGAWRLIHRTPADLYYRAMAAGIPSGASTVGAEPTGVNLYVDAVKSA